VRTKSDGAVGVCEIRETKGQVLRPGKIVDDSEDNILVFFLDI